MDVAWSWSAAVNVASGVVMALLGAVLLVANPRKDWNRVFALFACFWGIQIVSLNVVRVTTSEAVARFTTGLSLAFLIPLYFFIVSFASIFPRPRGPFGTNGFAITLLMLPAAGTLLVLFAEPSLLLSDVSPTSGGAFTAQWGPLLPWLVTAPFYGGMFFALFAMMQRLPESESAIERKQIAFVLAALALYLSYYTPILLLHFGRAALGAEPVSEAGRAEAFVFALIMLAGLALLAALARRLNAERRRATGAGERREAQSVLAVLAAGLATAGLAILTQPLGASIDIALLGVVRIASVALIVYAIVRYQLFDVDLRVKQVAATGAALVAVLALGAAAWIVLGRANVPVGLGGAITAIAAVIAFVPLLRVSSTLADRIAPRVSPEGDHLYLRKLEVYRAAVEAASREGRAASSAEPMLAETRAKLGLTERDHAVVVSLAATRAEAPRAAPDLAPGGVAFGKYQIDSLIAEGGFGRVFLARDRILGRPVVVKELLAKWRGDAAVVRTFLREAQIAGQLNHPNIVAIHEVEQHGQDYYVVMEYVSGGTLQERLASAGRLAPEEALRIASAVLEALAVAHARGVVHRDVKPGNVLLGARGEVKLADFGIAQLAEEDADRTISGLTSGGFHPGTLQYMSPEQARGQPLDARTDVYAAGALLYRMLAGKPHVDIAGLDELAARNAVAHADAPPPIPHAGPDVNAILAKALARDPARRHASAREFAEALAPHARAR